ncbi:hypothetical protein Cgig2_008411 [Carnegiea gigantea]|uniref:Uncharacterized protein n=1 Tax=Carnegiea gigantea TaxID=171969 RepID=A0A9Q1JTY9_9CARY|nr:hypothetical protein Cgig2_008411 [Carnegiea gigantea]
MGKAPCCDKARVKKGPWSAEEDTLLMNFIARFGNGGNWISLPRKAGLNRCGKSCRLRWLNYLRPDIKHGGFTEEEGHIIYNLYNIIGSRHFDKVIKPINLHSIQNFMPSAKLINQSWASRWSVIASNLPGRTDNDVKNYWHTKLKKKILGGKVNDIIPPSATIASSGISSKMRSSNLISPTPDVNLWQIQDEQCPPHCAGYSEILTIEENSSISTTSSSSGISRAPSSLNSEPDSCAFTSTSSTQENGFWIDLLSESFDDDFGADYFQLQEKIKEIASLLNLSPVPPLFLPLGRMSCPLSLALGPFVLTLALTINLPPLLDCIPDPTLPSFFPTSGPVSPATEPPSMSPTSGLGLSLAVSSRFVMLEPTPNDPQPIASSLPPSPPTMPISRASHSPLA